VVLSNLQVIHSGNTRTVAWRGKVPVPDIRGRVIARGIVNESLVNALSPVIRLGSWQREKRLWPVACGGRVPSLDDFGPQPGPPAVTNSGLVQRLIQCHYYVQRLIRLSPAHVVLADNGELQPRHLVRRVRTRRIDTARTCPVRLIVHLNGDRCL
jgi:hypothetical protein